MSEDDARWYEDMVRNNWQMPIVAYWKRWPVIRHVRAYWHMTQINRYRQAMRSTGMGMLDSGYDNWILYGMFRGREGKLN